MRHVEVLGGKGGHGAPKDLSRERGWGSHWIPEPLFLLRPARGLWRVMSRVGPGPRSM